MKVVRIVAWSAGAAVVLAVIAAAVIYATACRVPSNYQYRPLAAEQQKQALDELVAQVFDFGNKAGAGEPFTWTLTAQQAGRYLASLDAVASLFDAKEFPSTEMEKIGLSGPAVAMRPGVLTLMVHSLKYDKIISVDLTFAFDAAGSLTAHTQAVKVGVLPAPRSFLAGVQQRACRELAEKLGDAEKLSEVHLGPVPLARFARLLRNVVGMLDGQAVRPELVWPRGKHRVLVERLEIDQDRLTLHVVPLSRRRPAATSETAGTGGE